MTTTATDGEMLFNALFHSAVVSGLEEGCARLGKMAIGGSPLKLDFSLRDGGMVVVDVTLAMATKDMLIKRAHSSRYHEVMASIAVLVGGTQVNANCQTATGREGRKVSKTD